MIPIAFIASILALAYGVVLFRKVLAAPTCTEKANEIAEAPMVTVSRWCLDSANSHAI